MPTTSETNLERLQVELPFQQLEEAFRRLYADGPVSLTDCLPEVIASLALASTKFTSKLKPSALKHLLDCFETDAVQSKTLRVSVVTRLYEIAETLFQTVELSEEEVTWTSGGIDALITESREDRLTLPQVLRIVDREARRIHSRLMQHLNPPPMSVDDLRHELYIYLLDNIERNFKPAQSSYLAYVSMTLHLRGRRLYSTILRDTFREAPASTAEDTDSDTYLDYLLQSPSSCEFYQLPPTADAVFDRKELMHVIHNQLTSFEKSLLLTTIHMNGNLAGVFPFAVDSSLSTLSAKIAEHLRNLPEM